MAPSAPAAAKRGVGFAWLFEKTELRSRLLFTLGMVGLFRLGAQVPIWGVNAAALKVLASNQLLGFLDLFSGGALASLSVVALGIGPYITASIIVQLLSAIIPRLEELQKEEGEQGRRQISQITRYLSVVLAVVQGLLVLKLFTLNPQVIKAGVAPALFYPVALLSLVAGSLWALWLSELITDRGIGNGTSILIFVGIVAALPFYAQQTAQLVSGDPARMVNLAVLLLIYLGVMALIILLQEAVRKVYIVQAKRQVGSRLYGGGSSFIPFKINPAGVMPIIFTFAVLAFPQALIELALKNHPTGWVLGAITGYKRLMGFGSPVAIAVQFALIIFFSYFYSSLVPSMQPKEIAEQLKKHGNAIAGVKPGQPTAQWLGSMLNKLTLIGAVLLAFITLAASSATAVTGISTLSGLGSTALIILVGVALDLVQQVKVHLLVKQYEGFLGPKAA